LIAWLGRLGRFLLTVRFGVVLMIVLMIVMMFATQFEASYGTRAMKTYIYGSRWFDLGVFLFVVNIVVNTFRRMPFRLRHTGFLTVHAGVLIIVAGGLMTRWFGVDGTMPIPEGEASRAISLPDNDLLITAGGQTVRHPTHYDVLPGRAEHDDLYDVPGTPYLLHVTRYYPTGAVADTVLDDAEEENPVVRVALGTGTEDAVSDWLVARDPTRNRLTSGGVRLAFVDAGQVEALRARWETAARRASSAPVEAGRLRLNWSDGGSEVLVIPRDADAPLPTSRPDVTVEVVQVFRSFTLPADGHADAVDRPDNPAIRFEVHGPHGVEDHFSFTAFPEFRMSPPEGTEWVVSHAFWEPDSSSLGSGGETLEVVIAREAPGRFVTWTSWEDPLDGTPLVPGESRVFTGRRVLVRILESLERGRVTRTVRKVSDEVIRPVLKVALVERDDSGRRMASLGGLLGRRPEVRSADVSPRDAWVFHDEQFDFDTPHGPVGVRYAGRSIPLDFAVHLEDFREEKYPGVSLAASYESHVVVQPDDEEEFRTRIYMNHPLIYAGYTFYQASFQRAAGGQEITVLSVARDPGMTVSFFGYCVLVTGLVLIFFVKPYLRKLDDRIARSRAAAQGA